MNNFNQYVQTLETYVMFQIGARTRELTPELVAKNRKPILLSMGAPVDMVPKYVVDKLKEALEDPSIHTYSTPKGESYFLDAVAKRMKTRFGVNVDPKNEVFSLIGSKEGIANIIRELINPVTNEKEQDIILIPDPGYASYKEMLKVSGGLAYSVPLTKENDYMPNFEEILKNLATEGYDPKKVKALVLNYPNNPLGATCSVEYLQSAVDFCKKHSILLIADNAYSEIYFNEEDRPISILECNGAMDVAIEFHSFSKPYAMTGWRLGWVCGNAKAISMFGKLKSTIDTGVFKALQKAGAELLLSSEGDEYIQNANLGFERKLKEFAKGLKELGWTDVEIPKATFYLWIKTPERFKTDKEFCDVMLEKSGIVIVPGDAFGKYGKGYVRLSIVAGEEQLKEVIERMKIDGHTYGG